MFASVVFVYHAFIKMVEYVSCLRVLFLVSLFVLWSDVLFRDEWSAVESTFVHFGQVVCDCVHVQTILRFLFPEQSSFVVNMVRPLCCSIFGGGQST